MIENAERIEVTRPHVSGHRKKIAIYGLFGQRNWGNECTIQAIIHHARRYHPDADLTCFCTDPHDISQRYKIPAFAVSNRFAKGYPKKSDAKANLLVRLWRMAFIRIPRELASWFTA